MICPKCGNEMYCTKKNLTQEEWHCFDCGYSVGVLKNSHTTTMVTELPAEIEINGIKYRRVEE